MKRIKALFAMLLCCALLFSLLPAAASAMEADTYMNNTEYSQRELKLKKSGSTEAQESDSDEPDSDEPDSEEPISGSEPLPEITYVDANGQTQTCTDYTVINSDNMLTALEAGWYVVQGTVNYPTGGITCSGAVHLILTDGCALTVKGADENAGIGVGGVNSLAIYGQTAGTGMLTATGGESGGAGIGAGHDANGSNITINGGTVLATGGPDSAGIGSGWHGTGSDITINGGTVTATGGPDGAGIGGGHDANGSNIAINGGTVTATGGFRGAGIGGGGNRSGIDITINGGTVMANGGAHGAGIGGGDYGSGSNITITGGYIKAAGKNGENIGSGDDGPAATDISLSGGCYTNMPDANYISSESYLAYNRDRETSADYPYTILAREKEVEYIKADGTTGVCDDYILINEFSMPVTLGSADTETWYAVFGTADYDEGDSEKTCVNVLGNVNLILTDGAALGAEGTPNKGKAGIRVSGSGNSLTVYGQKEGTGKLNGAGSSIKIAEMQYRGGAGIGGDNGEPGGNITIVGGEVNGIGKNGGAGIGGGYGGDGSNITVIDGNVTAHGYTGGAGIGGGYGGIGSNITISGGTVNAAGFMDGGAGIGGGQNSSGSSITISGGNVTAQGGNTAAGIGGGFKGSGIGITITGGAVTANGGYTGAGIGSGGRNASVGSVAVSGGCVNAKGGLGADDIGDGQNAEAATTVSLSGGCYTNEPKEDDVVSGYYITDNTDTATNTDYPYTVLPHAHEWSYSVTGYYNDTITASCIGKGNCTLTDITLTISGDCAQYNGNPHNAGFGDTTSFCGSTELPEISYEYRADSNETYAPVTQTVKAGEYRASFTLGSGEAAVTAFAEYSVSPLPLMISGTTVSGKVYDGTTVAEVTPGTVEGILPGDDVQLSATATFAQAEAGEGISVAIVYTITGTDAENYLKPEDASTEADITKCPVTVNITGSTGTYAFDGKKHTVTGFTTDAPDGVSVSLKSGSIAEASRTQPGKSRMNLTRTMFTASSANYQVTIGKLTDGWIKITPHPGLKISGKCSGVFYADGIPVEAEIAGDFTFVDIPGKDSRILTYYELHTGSDAHTSYPTLMKVWSLSYDSDKDCYQATHLNRLDNLLTYCGTSIRTNGNRGLRVITGIDESVKKQLIEGLYGYKLTEYGTVMAWSDSLNGQALTLKTPGSAYNCAYSAANGTDPIFAEADGMQQYTNVLILADLPDSSLGDDITMRPYLKVTDENGQELVIYGGQIERSVGYVAYRNANAFKPGSSQYEYIWDIIRAVYGSSYDDEYRTK